MNTLMNNVIITGVISFVDDTRTQYTLRLPGRKQPFYIRFRSPSLKRRFLEGDRVRVVGRIASLEMNFPLTCHDALFTYIRTYVEADSMELDTSPKAGDWNYCQVSGTVVSTPKVVEINHVLYSTVRLRLEDGLGYVTVNLPTVANVPNLYEPLTVSGVLKAKDYQKKQECPVCGHRYTHSFLTVWIVAEKAPPAGRNPAGGIS